MWRKKSSKILFTYKVCDELPTHLVSGVIYLEGRKNKYWIAAFICPCGCNQVIYLNLIKEADPCWRININWLYGISIFPSIDRINGCRSHFVIEKGKVYWCYPR